jgi:hypothetical protein
VKRKGPECINGDNGRHGTENIAGRSTRIGRLKDAEGSRRTQNNTHPIIIKPPLPHLAEHLLRCAHERGLDALAGARGSFGEEEALCGWGISILVRQ